MVVATRIIQVSPEQLHLEALPKATRRAFLECIQWKFLSKTHWYLAGGTALTL